MVFSMAPVDAPRPKAPTWRDGTAFPSSFNPNSAPPPNPAGSAASEGWLYGTGRSAARTLDRGVGYAADFAGASWKTATEYWGRGAAWVKEKLLHAPLAAYTRISSEFGSRFHPTKKRMRHHDGVDFAAKQGTAVFSAGEGVVESAGWKGGYGKAIVIRHPSGTETLYGHLSAIGVVKGQKVSMGRVIGQVGSTGQSTGPHLHYEVRRNGAPVDPLKVASL
ncbi:MAG: M23 family metallopeptidase [Elusimicrobia bacterium]|nr:M23 family metallopeptidase [Elusimicrobiota bacterium]